MNHYIICTQNIQNGKFCDAFETIKGKLDRTVCQLGKWMQTVNCH